MDQNKLKQALFNTSKNLIYIKENIATKDDLRNIANTMDVLVGLAKKKDQELTFMGERVKRVEYDVEKIKPLVGLV